MIVIYLAFIYVMLHLCFYISFGRNIVKLRSESGIFLLHLFSFIFLGIVSLLYTLLSDANNSLPSVCGTLAMHGIYSISFLELWSLSQGSYSLTVLRMLPMPLATQTKVLQDLEAVGDSKFSDRITAIQKLGLVQSQGGAVRATRLGIAITTLFYIIAKLTNIEDRG